MKKLTTRMTATWVLALFFSFCLLTKAQAQTDTVTAQNRALVQSLKPEAVWQHFATLCSIPRCPGNEKEVAKLIFDLASANQLYAYVDKMNNVLVKLPATKGYEKRPFICIQGHLDMVCQSKDNRANIFPIKLIKSGDSIYAGSTTLGADDGFGVAAMMALISETEIQHGPLELLFTAQEENGFVGAEAFNYKLLKSKIILNVDSEEKGVITIGCAGGAVMETVLVPKFISTVNQGSEVVITISNLLGGHSGGDINLGHANAITVLAELIVHLKRFDIGIVDIQGGTAVNAIPRDCKVTLYVPTSNNVEFINEFALQSRRIQIAFPFEKPQLSIRMIENSERKNKVMSKESGEKLLKIIADLPNGVISMENGSSDLVRTSNNVGIIAMSGDSVYMRTLFRSSSNQQIDSLIKAVKAICKGQPTKLLFRFSPWEPNFKSPLVATGITEYKKLFGYEPKVSVTHGGLEAALLYKLIPGAQIISFGAQIDRAHSPSESVEIPSVNDSWKFLLSMIQR